MEQKWKGQPLVQWCCSLVIVAQWVWTLTHRMVHALSGKWIVGRRDRSLPSSPPSRGESGQKAIHLRYNKQDSSEHQFWKVMFCAILGGCLVCGLIQGLMFGEASFRLKRWWNFDWRKMLCLENSPWIICKSILVLCKTAPVPPCWWCRCSN